MCANAGNAILSEWRITEYAVILFFICVSSLASLVQSADQTTSSINTLGNIDPKPEELVYLSYLAQIAMSNHFGVEDIKNNSKINATREVIFQEMFTKLLFSLQHLKRATVDVRNEYSCESLPEVAAGINLRRFCKEALATKCLSAKQLVNIVPKSVDTFPDALSYACPFLLLQSHDQVCQKEIKDGPPKKPSSKPSSSAVWGFGFLFVTIVSCCSLVGVGLLPLLSKSFYHMVLVLFEGLAVGSLASSALFHLIPQAFNLLGQDAQHNYLWKALIIFGGIYLFFLSERSMKIFIQRKEKKKRKKSELSRNGNHLSLNISPSASAVSTTTLENGVLGDMPKEPDGEICLPTETREYHTHSHNHHQHQPLQQGDSGKGKNVIATVAWMIIFGDGLHNFIDGLSMGAAFSESILSGISISVAVICEEFPHELGDFAVLLSAGMTMKQALMYNFLSACTCYLGLVFGVFLGDLAEGGPYIFALAGGMFLYISLVDMVGELSEALETASKEGTKEMLKVFALQNIGILVGVAALFLMARYSEKINFEAISNGSAATGGMMPQITDLFQKNQHDRALEDAMLGL